MLGKHLSSLFDGNLASSRFNEHMIEKMCENEGQLQVRGTSSIHAEFSFNIM